MQPAPGPGHTPVMTLALVNGPIAWPTLRQCASLSSRGDAMQKLDTGGSLAVRVQQFPRLRRGRAGAGRRIAHAAGRARCPVEQRASSVSGYNHRQAETTRSQQPAASGVVVVDVDVVDVVVVDEGAIVVVVEPGTVPAQ